MRMKWMNLTLAACLLSVAAIGSWAEAGKPAPDRMIVEKKSGTWEIATSTTVFQVSTDDVVPARDGFSAQTPALEVVYANGTRICELKFAGSEITRMGDDPCLRMDLKDAEYGLEVSVFARVLRDYDMLERWMLLKNTSGDVIRVENAMSASLALPKDEYELTHLAGEWGHEFMPQRTPLTPGIKTLQVRDFKHFANPPWFAVARAGTTSETSGELWFGGLVYSGNWRLDFAKAFNGGLQITGGINFWDTHWSLRPGETFETPKMVVGRASDGLTGAATRMHRYIRQRLLPKAFRDKPRPVIYNSWYATGHGVNEKQQIELARIAKEMGVELFMLDDGWFKNRIHGWEASGDWTVDKNKFPNGLGPMIAEINKLGLDFGIWVEPERVNPDSDLYRAHPDWAMHFADRDRYESRNVMVLNLAREDVCQYLVDVLSALLRENNIRYMKWDHNCGAGVVGWPEAPDEMQREVRIRYVHNLYRIIDTLRERFPDVWFENCSGGGGRPDMGMLSHMDLNWTSDNTDPASRIMIQYGYLHAFPAKTMLGLVTHENWTGYDPTVQFRFHVSMAGVLGIGYDLTKLTEAERKEAAKYVAQYKEIRPVVQEGTLYRLLSPFEGHRAALEYVSEDKSEAVGFQYNLWQPLDGSVASARGSNLLLLRGLDPCASYILSGGPVSGAFSGRQLMEEGIPWAVRGPEHSAIIHIKKGVPPLEGAKVISVSSESRRFEAANILDGNPYSFWHSEFRDEKAGYPHEIRIDLGKARKIAGVRLLQRQDGDSNGWVKDIAIYVSNKPDKWKDAAARASLAASEEWQEVRFSTLTKARYIRLEFLSPVDETQRWAALAEFEVMETAK
jgi:alpha-galactosidase